LSELAGFLILPDEERGHDLIASNPEPE
jgi:hypothetical protein